MKSKLLNILKTINHRWRYAPLKIKALDITCWLVLIGYLLYKIITF